MKLDIKVRTIKEVLFRLRDLVERNFKKVLFMFLGAILAWYFIILSLLLIIPYAIIFKGEDKWELFFKPLEYCFEIMKTGAKQY